MNKATSALLASAGVTVGLLGFALPAGAATAAVAGHHPTTGQCSYLPVYPPAGTGLDSQTKTGDDQRPNKGSDYGQDGNYGQDGKGKDHGKKPDPCPTDTKSPCPTHTYKPCPPKPCQPVVSKPCKPHRGKDGHWTSYQQQPKHVLVCKPKPCPTKAKPCPPKCKKNQHHPHTHPQQRGGIN
jgi:hypothetical protein